MEIRVPATSANLGPGFDSCGLAVSLYLTIEVLEPSEQWEILHFLGDEIPSNEKNLMIKTALKVAPHLQPHRLKMTSEIPLTRGLGSSSSVIVAGIELANQLGKLDLTQAEKLIIATEIEGHPDNVAPAICGDFVVATYAKESNEVFYVKQDFPECDLLAYIPRTELLTSESRQVLPSTFSYPEAVEASSIANVMVAAVNNGDLHLAGKMFEKDKWHESYRGEFVPHLTTIRQICTEDGAYGCFLSGAGPTVLVLSPTEKTSEILRKLETMATDADVLQLKIDRRGIQVF